MDNEKVIKQLRKLAEAYDRKAIALMEVVALLGETPVQHRAKRRKISAAGRRNIIRAQKARWAKVLRMKKRAA